MTVQSESNRQRDLSRQMIGFLTGWGIPIIILLSVNILQAYWPAAAIISMMGGAFIWMGVGCVINAMRCGRVHCRFSGPVMLIGGTLIVLTGFDIISLGAVRVMHISYATIALVALSFLPEFFVGAYGRKTNIDDET